MLLGRILKECCFELFVAEESLRHQILELRPDCEGLAAKSLIFGEVDFVYSRTWGKGKNFNRFQSE
jgi:hypothetical protein